MASSWSPDSLDRVMCLIIEDHADSAFVLEAILHWRCIQTRTVSSATEARSVLETEQPDLIICDLKLGRESGLAFLRWLRAAPSPALSRTPAIAVTGYYDEFTAGDVKESGFDLYLTKPVDPERLLEHVMVLLEQHKHRR